MGGIYIEYWDEDISFHDNICAGTVTIERSYFDEGAFAISCGNDVAVAYFSLIYQY